MDRINIELFFPLELKDKPIICRMIKEFDLVVIIREASFSTSTGWACLTLEGENEEISKALNYLKRQGIKAIRRD